MKNKLRVLVLMHADLVPPESIQGLSESDVLPFKMEYDVMVTLDKLGHQARALGLADELVPIREQIEEWKPHVAFNVLTHFHGVATYDAHVVSYLELLKQPYTGSNPRGILLAGDKALSKKILSYHRIPVPAFAVFPQGSRRRKLPARLTFPVIIKSVVEHGSTGIAQASVVHDEASLVERVDFVHRTLATDAIAEQYIEGRELTIGVLGNERLQVFPVWEMFFENLPEGTEPIATARVKWDAKYAERIGVKTGQAKEISKEQEKAIGHLAKRTFRALELSGFARIDLRMDADGKVFVIEANPNPDLTFGEDLAESAHLVGLKYPELVQKILNLGIGYKPAWMVE